MPPLKLIWPKTEADFDREVEAQKKRFAPLLDKMQIYELIGMNEALGEALEKIKPMAAMEDVRRGYRPRGTQIGRG